MVDIRHISFSRIGRLGFALMAVFFSTWDHIHNCEGEVGVQQREVQVGNEMFAEQKLSFSNNCNHY